MGALLGLVMACGGKKDAADGGAAGRRGPGGKDGGPPKVLPYAAV